MKTWGIYTRQFARFALLNHVELKDKSQIHVTLEVKDENGQAMGGMYQAVMGTVSGRTQHYAIQVAENGSGESVIYDVDPELVSISIADACGDPLMNQEQYAISYFVDGVEAQENFAKFTVCKEVHKVLIVMEQLRYASLSLVLMRQNPIGDTISHEEDEVFTYTLHTPTRDICMTLDCRNDWRAECKGLKQGVYELCDENGYEGEVCHYLDGEVSDCRFLLEGDHTLVINEVMTHCSILTVRFASDCEESETRVHIVSSDHCFDEWFTLCRENHYLLELDDLPNGVYSIQSDDDGLCYQVDCDRVKENYALLRLEGGEHLIELIRCDHTPADMQGNLKIRKFIRDEYGLEVDPACDEAFAVRVCGCGKDDVYYLNASNSWSVDIGCLCAGTYTIEEQCDCEYEVNYRINRGRMQSEACVEIDPECRMLVEIINERKASGKLIISKYVMKEDGCWHRPDEADVFYFSLRGFDYRNMITLNCENNWYAVIDHLCPGCYELKEHGSCDEVCFSVDHGCMQNHGRVCLEGGDCKEIAVYNRNKGQRYGSLSVSKWINTACGDLVRPDTTQRYEVIVESDHQMYSLCLHAGNGFCALLDRLEEGCYRISELHEEAQYVVNGKALPKGECASVMVCGNDHEVAIINEETPRATLQIEALFVDGDGNTCEMGEALRVCLQSCAYEEEIELNEDNNWCMCLTDLPQGTYRITQLSDNGCLVRYVVDGVCRPYANVVVKDSDVHVVLENQMPCCAQRVTLRKFVSDGERRFTPKEESYHLRIYNKCFDAAITLHADNGYCYVLHDMQQGTYYVEEDGCDFDMYVNNAPSDHTFTVGQEDVKVDIVNYLETKTRVCFEQRLVDENGCTLPLCDPSTFYLRSQEEECCFTLSADNDFEQCMLLRSGVYEIAEENDLDITLCINGKESSSGRFEVGNRPLSIQIIAHCCLRHTLCVEKWIRHNGMLRRPMQDECFEICLIAENGMKQYATMDAGSGWCAVFDDLEQGCYEIKEGMDDCYDASFIINGKEQEMGTFALSDHDLDIMLINTPLAEAAPEYTLTLCKRIDGAGCPDEKETFRFVISGMREEQVTLHAKNQFEAKLRLPKGEYQIKEENADPMQVTYYLNGQQLAKGAFHLKGNSSLVALNERPKQVGNLHLRAFAIDEEGNESALDVSKIEVQIEGIGTSKTITLKAMEGFAQSVALEKGRYEVSAQSLEQYEKRNYRIDGGKLRSYAFICMRDEDISVEIIYSKMKGSSLQISKFIKDEACGCLIKPQEQEVFQVEVSGEMRKTLILSSSNHWSETLHDLRSGDYLISETGSDRYLTTYLVDGVYQENGHVRLGDGHHQVQIINTPIAQSGSITLTKRLRGAGNTLIEPTRRDRFVFMVEGDQYREEVILDRSNAFQSVLEDLPAGVYTIREAQGGRVTYLIDGEDVGSIAQISVQSDKHQVIAINESRSGGQLRIDKVMRRLDGTLARPQTDQRFTVHITRSGFSEFYELNEANNWILELSLDNGLYVVNEIGGAYDTTYILDGQGETSFGNVQIQDDVHYLQIINTERRTATGSIALSKKVRDENGVLQDPPMSASYDFLISAPRFQETVTLDQSNRFQMVLNNLEPRTYVISEQGEEASFIIDGGYEVDFANVQVNGDAHTVLAINGMPASGNLRLEKVMRSPQGVLVSPQSDQSFEIHISKAGYNEYFVLNEANQWRLQLQLEPGTYHIRENDDRYETTYVIDGQSEVSYANVTIDAQVHDVQIINTQRSTNLHISKTIRSAAGDIRTPSDEQSFRVHISASGFNEFYDLNANNYFALDLTLPDGQYVINEVSGGYDTTYIVDGQSEVGYANVTIQGDNHNVQIINNEQSGGGSLLISKYVKAADGTYTRPSATDSFEVTLSSENFYQIYTLNADNLFTETIDHLPAGIYDVVESGSASDTVRYVVDSGAASDNARFVINNSAHTVRILNERGSSQSSIQLLKFIRRGDDYVKPQPEEVFTVRISGAYETDVILDASNNWDYTLQDLPQGDYKVEEISGRYPIVRYSLNGGNPLPVCEFTIVSDSRYLVGIINRESSVNATTVKMVLE